MHKGVHVILLPLFLCVLFGIISVLYSSSGLCPGQAKLGFNFRWVGSPGFLSPASTPSVLAPELWCIFRLSLNTWLPRFWSLPATQLGTTRRTVFYRGADKQYCIMALELIVGAAFSVLYDRVSQAVDRRVAFKDSLKDMKRTLESLRGQAGVIREIGEFNEELSLRNDGINDLETQMIEGEKLICRLSSLGICTCCISGCAEQLDELNRCLERLLQNLRLQQTRDVKEILKWSRQNHDDLEELKQMVKKLLPQNGDLVESPASETATENERSGKEQVASSEGRVEAAFLALLGIVLKVKDKNVMYRPLLGSIKSTLDCLKPLIEDMAQGNRVLDCPAKELEYFRMHMEKGAELVRKCSKTGVCAKYKKKKYTNELLELDACLQRQFNVLRVKVASDVRETTASIKSIQKMIKRIEESGVMKNRMEMNGPCEVVEASSPDEQSEGLVEPSSPHEQNEDLVSVSKMEAADIKVEGSGELHEESEISGGYGSVEFFSHATAENSLMPNTEQPFRRNWATFSTGDKRSDNAPDLSIFVGDLTVDVTDSLLHETFSSKYPSVKAAKVVFDASTGRSKGYGFVRFGDENERSQAMTEMNGVYCSGRPMRIGPATPRKSSGYQQQGSYALNGIPAQGFQSDGDATNTTIFVGGLDPNVTDEDLRQPFSQHGEIVRVKIPVGKGCGFVQFANRNNAEEALLKLNGSVIGRQTVRLSWGRNPANKQFRTDFGNQGAGAAYYGGPVYEGYGNALPQQHDPSMYAAAAAYGAYPVYGAHQQVS